MELEKKGENQVLLANAKADIAMHENVVGIVVKIKPQDAFGMIFSEVGDDNMQEAIWKEASADLREDIQELAMGIVAIIENKDVVKSLKGGFYVNIDLILDSENSIKVSVSDNLKDALSEDEDFSHILAMIEGLEYAYEVNYGVDTALKWEECVREGFEQPEQFMETVLKEFRVYNDEEGA